MSYSFDKTADDEEKEQSTPNKIRNLTDDYVFCPKCGAKNKFEITQDEYEVIYLCWQCKSELNDYWEDPEKNQVALVVCVNCRQYTFKDYNICVSCGLPKSKIKKPEEKVHKRFSSRQRSNERLFVYKRAETVAGRLFGGSGFRVNPNHPHARKITNILCIGILVLSGAAIALLVVLFTIFD